MNINQLKYVIEVSSASSMREASRKLYVSQPALSNSIKELEDELGILIFERTNKGISVTEEGREFIDYAKKAVGQYEIIEDRYLDKDAGREHFSVSIQHYNFAISAFTEMIKKEKLGKYTFSIRETRTKEVLDDVRNLKSEVGIVSFSGSNEEVLKKLFRDYQLEFTPLMMRDTYVYVWEDHPYANKKIVSLEDMKDFPCVSFDQSDDSNFYISEEAMGDYEFDKLIKSDDRATTLEIIASLNGYAVGCGMLSDEDAILKGMVAIKLKEQDPLTIGYITRKGRDNSEYGKAYIEELLKYKEV